MLFLEIINFYIFFIFILLRLIRLILMGLNLHLRLKFLFLEDLVNLIKLGFIIKVVQRVLLGIILILVLELKI